MHVDQTVLAQRSVYTKNEEQPKLGAWYNNSRGTGLLSSCLQGVIKCTFASTAMTFT